MLAKYGQCSKWCFWKCSWLKIIALITALWSKEQLYYWDVCVLFVIHQGVDRRLVLTCRTPKPDKAVLPLTSKPSISYKGKQQGVQNKVAHLWQNTWFHVVPTNLPSRHFLEQKLSRLCLELPLLSICFELSHWYTTQGSCLSDDSNRLAYVFVLGSSVCIWLGLRPPVVACGWAKRSVVSTQPTATVYFEQSWYQLVPVEVLSSRRWSKGFLIRFMLVVSLENSGLWKPPLNML